MTRGTATALAIALLMAVWSSPAQACVTLSRPITQAQIDEYAQRLLEASPEVFEGEIVMDGGRRGLLVTRVFKGQLQAGTTLWADRGVVEADSCAGAPPRPGYTGMLVVGFGPRGPTYVDSFVSDATADSLRRSGALRGR